MLGNGQVLHFQCGDDVEHCVNEVRGPKEQVDIEQDNEHSELDETATLIGKVQLSLYKTGRHST